MEVRGVVYDCGDDALNQKRKLKNSSPDHLIGSNFAPNSSDSFRGSRAMFSFGAAPVNESKNLFFRSFDQEEIVDEYFDEYYNLLPEKKRRLSSNQVRFLEKSFESENKLEPDRKSQLATELGLHPRQVAIWFQNRRARLKTKQVETEYEKLSSRYCNLKIDYDNLMKENEKLKAEVIHLKDNVLARDEKKGSSHSSDTQEAQPNEINLELGFTDDVHSSQLELGDSSPVFDSEDHFNEELLQPAYCQLHANSCYFGFPIEDHGFSFWSY